MLDKHPIKSFFLIAALTFCALLLPMMAIRNSQKFNSYDKAVFQKRLHHPLEWHDWFIVMHHYTPAYQNAHPL